LPALDFDGTNYLAVWADYRRGRPDIYGARVRPDGTVHDGGAIVQQDGEQLYPALAHGSGNRMFLTYQGWAATVGSEVYNDYRIWGKMDPSPAVEETMNDGRGTMNARATIIRGVLVLGAVDSRQHSAYRAELLDISGRKVMELRAGANDVSRLSSGVYFICSAGPALDIRHSTSSTKYVLTR
jgi:hypothetical protein